MACPQTDRWLEEIAWGGESPERAAHLAGCAECRREVERAERDVAAISAALRPALGTAKTREGLLEAARTTPQRPRGKLADVHPAARGPRRLWREAAAAASLAAAALLVAAFLYNREAPPAAPQGRIALYNVSTERLEEKLADGTQVEMEPGASIVARGRDQARGVRQLIILESGRVEVEAPRAAEGEVACRVETPDGMWVETAGTRFSVTRTYENEKGERNADKRKLGGTVNAVLLVAVAKGSVRAGGGGAAETRVAAGEKAAVGSASKRPSSVKIAWGKASGDLAAGLSAKTRTLESGEPMKFTVHLLNAGEKKLKLNDAGWSHNWRLVFTPGGSGAPRSPRFRKNLERSDPVHIEIPGGSEKKVALEVGNVNWLFEDARGRGTRTKKAAPIKALPPGKYAVTARYFYVVDGKSSHWNGTVTTAKLNIEIVESAAQRRATFKKLKDSIGKAEKAYAALRANPRVSKAAREKAYSAYVLASQTYIQAIVKRAEAMKRGSKEQKTLGALAVKEVAGWLKHQDDARYDAPPEGVEMVMRLYLGRGHFFAGDIDKAVKEGFDKVLAFMPHLFRAGTGRSWAWRVHLTASLYKALALAEAAAKTGKQADWKRALGAVAPEILFRGESSGRPLGIRARILQGQCLGKLGQFKLSADEFNRAFDEIEKLRKRRGAEARHAEGLKARAVVDMAEMVVAAIKAGVKIRVK